MCFNHFSEISAKREIQDHINSPFAYGYLISRFILYKDSSNTENFLILLNSFSQCPHR